MATAVQTTVERETYLNNGYGLKSWLLTKDHKRIALLYLISITGMFFVGGFFAMLIRLELLTPAGDLVSSDTYNKLFTMHGITMIFFFLIPSVPAVLGNFCIPLMVGAKDLAFPRLNLATLVHLHDRRHVCTGFDDLGRRGYRLDFLYAVQHHLLQHPRRGNRPGRIHRGVCVDFYRAELHRHHPPHAGAGNDLDAAAAVLLVELRRQSDHGAGYARNCHHPAVGSAGARVPHRRVQSCAGRRSAAVPAPVLVLLASGGVHHDPAGYGRDERDRDLLRAQTRVWLRVRRAGFDRHRGAGIPGLGPPHVRRRHLGLRRAGLFALELPRGDSVGGEDLQLDGHAIQRLDPVRDPDAVCVRLHRPVHRRRTDRACSWPHSESMCT